MAKSMLDSRIIDLSFNKIFLKLVLGERVALTLNNLKVPSIFNDPIVIFILLRSSLILIFHHHWRNFKCYLKRPVAERLVDFLLYTPAH